MLDQFGHIGGEPSECRFAPVIPLIHVEAAVDLDLQGMTPPLRTAVMPGREAAGIGRIERDSELPFGQKAPRRLDDLRRAGGAVAIAEDDIGSFLAAGG